MTTEMMSSDESMVHALERWLNDSDLDWSPYGSRVDPYMGETDEAVRGWMWCRIRRFVIRRDMGICQLCGFPIQAGEEQVHHIVFRCHGGSDHPMNLMSLDRSCHEALHRNKVEIYEVL
ncbi:MAG: HNH endonuclease [Dehalococcoidales bacterium]|jgi:5-methylcytosine-specific restriction endonuclease McrA|nr:HNH endonuclease [Sphaerochaeta sp.]MDD5512065.1 HNH endonuclease [Dehalococcoidales bacterium]